MAGESVATFLWLDELASVYAGSGSSPIGVKLSSSSSLFFFFIRQSNRTTAAIEKIKATTPTPIPALAPALKGCGSSSSKKEGRPDPVANGGRPPAVRKGGGPEKGEPLPVVDDGRPEVMNVEELIGVLVILFVEAVGDGDGAGVAITIGVLAAASLVGVSTGVLAGVGSTMMTVAGSMVGAGSTSIIVVAPVSVVVSAML
jgi:hypothetical protein